MKEKLQFVRLPILLFIVFFIGKLAMGAASGVNKESYDLSNRLFSMVILQTHVALFWGAFGRRYEGYPYVAGVNTLFTFPEALNAQTARTFSEALTIAHNYLRCQLRGGRNPGSDRLDSGKSHSRWSSKQVGNENI